MEVLRHCFPANLRHTLEELPKSLDDTYKRILKDINNANRVHAYRLLQCLAVASRPLRVEELAEVLAFDFTGKIPKSISDWRWEDREAAVLLACSSLVSVIIHNGSRVVQFSHFSVKEFLTSDRLTSYEEVSKFYIPIEPSHVILAQACLGTLLRLDDHTDKGSVEKIPLFRYASEYWHQHALIGNVELEIADALDCFIDTENPHFSSWVRLQGRKNLGIACFVIPDDAPVSVSPLCFAAGKGLCSLVERITIKHPQLVNQFDHTFGSPLHASVFGGGHIEVAQFLFEHGADINSRTAFDNTPLHIASVHGHINIGKWLLDHGADVNFSKYKYKRETPLSLASANGHFEFAQILLEHNADINSRDDEGSTPLYYALCNGNLDVIKLLLDHGADIHVRYESGKTPLHFAAAGGHFELVRKLLELNAEVNSRDYEGYTPTHYALVHANLDTALLLLDHGADVQGRYKSGRTLLHFAAAEGHLDFVRKLLELNAEVNSRDGEGFTPLYCALQNGKLDVVQLLLNNGADVRVRVRNQLERGNTPLHLAAAGGHLEVAQKLLTLNAEVNSRNNRGSTPLLLASASEHTGVLQLLVDHNADLSVHDRNGNTPLHCAAFECRHEVARILLKHNVDVNSRNAEGSTPLHLAVVGHGSARKDIVQFLLDHNANVQARDFSGQTASEALSETVLKVKRFFRMEKYESESEEIVKLLSLHAAK